MYIIFFTELIIMIKYCGKWVGKYETFFHTQQSPQFLGATFIPKIWDGNNNFWAIFFSAEREKKSQIVTYPILIIFEIYCQLSGKKLN